MELAQHDLCAGAGLCLNEWVPLCGQTMDPKRQEVGLQSNPTLIKDDSNQQKWRPENTGNHSDNPQRCQMAMVSMHLLNHYLFDLSNKSFSLWLPGRMEWGSRSMGHVCACVIMFMVGGRQMLCCLATDVYSFL